MTIAYSYLPPSIELMATQEDLFLALKIHTPKNNTFWEHLKQYFMLSINKNNRKIEGSAESIFFTGIFASFWIVWCIKDDVNNYRDWTKNLSYFSARFGWDFKGCLESSSLLCCENRSWSLGSLSTIRTFFTWNWNKENTVPISFVEPFGDFIHSYNNVHV